MSWIGRHNNAGTTLAGVSVGRRGTALRVTVRQVGTLVLNTTHAWPSEADEARLMTILTIRSISEIEKNWYHILEDRPTYMVTR